MLRESEGIAHIIGHVLNFRDLIVVREDDGIELFLERQDIP